jgi:Carboxypeptidase regulatory-like domain
LLPLALGVLLLAQPASAAAAEPESGSIAGTVTDEAMAPLVEVEVCAEAVDKSHFKCIPTRTDGTYEITGLSPGEYKVGFWTTRNFVTQFHEHALTWSTATPVPVVAGQTTGGINATLEVGATISGIVTAQATGLPVGEVEACATLGELERCVESDAAGHYLIDGLVPGSWSIYFYAQKAKVDVVSGAYSGGSVTVTAEEAKKGEGATGVNVALIPGGQIAGTVRLAGSGVPVGGVLVCVTMAAESVPLGCLRTPSSGAYRFTRVWPGSFKVAFSPEPKELFGPEGLVEAETMEATEGLGPDSYPTQWWSGQSGFEAATPIAIAPPQIVSGIDASLVAPAATAAAPAPANPAPVVQKPLLKCKRGFVKRKVHGKQRCVKRHKAKPKPRHKRRPVQHPASQSPAKRP